MSEIPVVTLFGREVSVYFLLAAAAYLAFAALMIAAWKKKKARSAAPAVLFAVLAAVLGLLLGRLIYCSVRFNRMFYDEMGDWRGLLPFWMPQEGSVNVIGVLLGCLLAALCAGKMTGTQAGKLLDSAAPPGLGLFAALRFIEPLSGQGYGPLVESPLLCWTPLSIDSGWDSWSLSVCFLEGLLLLAVAAAVWKLPCKKDGTRALYALALMAGTQIIPETFRQDNVLLIFIFASVTQIGYAVLLFSALAVSLRGMGRKTAAREIPLFLLGVALLVGAEFALDKTEWSPLLLYIGMFLILGGMTAMTVHRIRRHDKSPA